MHRLPEVDGIVSGGEECDCGDDQFKGTRAADCLGPNKDKEYGGCGTDCRFGPFCGDGEQNGPEQCDKGKDNGASYGQDGCTVGCTTPHFCGDGVHLRLQAAGRGSCLQLGVLNIRLLRQRHAGENQHQAGGLTEQGDHRAGH